MNKLNNNKKHYCITKYTEKHTYNKKTAVYCCAIVIVMLTDVNNNIIKMVRLLTN